MFRRSLFYHVFPLNPIEIPMLSHGNPMELPPVPRLRGDALHPHHPGGLFLARRRQSLEHLADPTSKMVEAWSGWWYT